MCHWGLSGQHSCSLELRGGAQTLQVKAIFAPPSSCAGNSALRLGQLSATRGLSNGRSGTASKTSFLSRCNFAVI